MCVFLSIFDMYLLIKQVIHTCSFSSPLIVTVSVEISFKNSFAFLVLILSLYFKFLNSSFKLNYLITLLLIKFKKKKAELKFYLKHHWLEGQSLVSCLEISSQENEFIILSGETEAYHGLTDQPDKFKQGSLLEQCTMEHSPLT